MWCTLHIFFFSADTSDVVSVRKASSSSLDIDTVSFGLWAVQGDKNKIEYEFLERSTTTTTTTTKKEKKKGRDPAFLPQPKGFFKCVW